MIKKRIWAAGGKTNNNGSKIITAKITKTSGKAKILKNILILLCRTNWRADLRAFKGVISGSVDIYNAKIEEVIIYKERRAKTANKTIQIIFSRAVMAKLF